MKKKEFILACKKKAKEVGGMIAPSLMFDLFNDTEDIPEEWTNMFVLKPEQLKPPMVLVGPVRAKQLEEALKNHPNGKETHQQ